ncbi:MAG: pentapeptide repeat-containing protein, partial [Neisseriaceae bacterium]
GHNLKTTSQPLQKHNIFIYINMLLYHIFALNVQRFHNSIVSAERQSVPSEESSSSQKLFVDGSNFLVEQDTNTKRKREDNSLENQRLFKKTKIQHNEEGHLSCNSRQNSKNDFKLVSKKFKTKVNAERQSVPSEGSSSSQRIFVNSSNVMVKQVSKKDETYWVNTPILKSLVSNLEMTLEDFLYKFRQLDNTNKEQLIEHYKKNIDLNNDTSYMVYLAHIYAYVDFGEFASNKSKAFELYDKAMNNNHIKSVFFYGYLKYKDGIKLSQFAIVYEQALKSKKSLDQVRNLIYKIGCKFDIISRDKNDCIFWYEKAANMENIHAMYMLGNLYLKYECGIANIEKAISWHMQAANKGLFASMLKLGMLYEKQSNLEESLIWYEKAANLGSAHAMYTLGYLYDEPKNPNKSFEKSIYWYQKAADLGYKDAMVNIGELYEDAEKMEQAISWYTKASEFGDIPITLKLAFIYFGTDFHNFRAGKNLLEKIVTLVDRGLVNDSRYEINYRVAYECLEIFNRLEALEASSKNLIYTIVNVVGRFSPDFLLALIMGKANLFENIINAVIAILDSKGFGKKENLDYRQMFSDVTVLLQKIMNISNDEKDVYIGAGHHEKSILGILSHKVNFLFGCCFSELDFSEIVFVKCQFLVNYNQKKYINFSGLKLTNGTFSETVLCQVNLSNVNLYGAIFNKVTLKRIDMRGVSLKGVTFYGTSFEDALLDLDQLEYIESLEPGKVRLCPTITISNKSIYEKVYQIYKLMLCVDKNDYDNLLNQPDELLQLQLILVFHSIVYEIEKRGMLIENRSEIDLVLRQMHLYNLFDIKNTSMI